MNPVKGVRLLNPNNARDRLLSSEETARLFSAANEFTDYVRPLFHILYHTGMRVGEALVLEWADIQTDHARIVVRDSKSGEGRGAESAHARSSRRGAWALETHCQRLPLGVSRSPRQVQTYEQCPARLATPPQGRRSQ